MSILSSIKAAAIVALPIASLMSEVKADQPVHCLRDSIYGLWEFQISKDTQNVNLFQAEEVCTHKLPNRLQFINSQYKFTFAEQTKLQVSLMDKYKVEAWDPANKEKKINGTWSPIYSQSLLVELENGQRFITNFRYNLNENISKDPLTKYDHKKLGQMKTGDLDFFNSSCSQTMVGVVQHHDAKTSSSMQNFPATCFIGQ